MAVPGNNQIPPFQVLDASKAHTFRIPSKRINVGNDLSTFLVSHAYRDILAFIMHLNRSMFPEMDARAIALGRSPVRVFTLDGSPSPTQPTVVSLQSLLHELHRLIESAPPDPGPRRFGNIGFRNWSNLVEEQSAGLLKKHLPAAVLEFKHEGATAPLEELLPYLLGAFGSPQRLDYGTGHELSFLAFVGCIWKLGGFGADPSQDDMRQIVTGVLQPYLVLVRKLILTYTLEPAGSHGVWGLDDHSFLPYIFGSAQFGPTVRPGGPTPTNGSIRSAPDPGKVTSSTVVEEQRSKNMYFSAIGFIYDVKKGAFWEHSPTLYDISGVKAGWGKINKGMLKMYDAEVLGKFPVVQHFPFGSLFSFEKDANAKPPVTSIHAQNQPQTQTQPSAAHIGLGQRVNTEGTKAPWATASSTGTSGRSTVSEASAANPHNASTSSTREMPPPTRAPWAR